MKTKTTASLLLAGLMAGGAWAQTAIDSHAYGSAPVTSANGARVEQASSTAVRGAPAGRELLNHDATVTANVPPVGGEFSTWTNGVPNMSTNNPVTTDTRVVMPRATEVHRVPPQAGEMSTMVNGRMNWNPDDPLLHQR